SRGRDLEPLPHRPGQPHQAHRAPQRCGAGADGQSGGGVPPRADPPRLRHVRRPARGRHRHGRDARRRGDARHRGRDPMRGAGRLALAAAVLLGGTLAPALAEDDVLPLEGGIIELDEGIFPLAGASQPLERTSTDGGATEITLSTDTLFATGSAEIAETAATRVVDLVQDVPRGAEVSIDGRTDSVPYRRGNQVLSEELAEARSEEHTSELQSRFDLVCRLLLEKKKI